MPKKNSVPNTVTVTLETHILKSLIQEREEAEDYDFLPDIQKQLAEKGEMWEKFRAQLERGDI